MSPKPRAPKSRFRAGKGSAKMPYKQWAYYCELMDEARKTYSWSQISDKLGRGAGFAATSREHRSIVDEKAVRDLESIVMKDRAMKVGVVGAVGGDRRDGTILTETAITARVRDAEQENKRAQHEEQAHRPDLSPPQEETPMAPDSKLLAPGVRRYRRMCTELREKHGKDWHFIAKVFGYSDGNSANTVFKQGNLPSKWRFDRADEIFLLMQAGREVDAERLANKPRGIEKAEPEPDTYAGLNRIGPPPPPSKAPEPRAPLPPPARKPEPPALPARDVGEVLREADARVAGRQNGMKPVLTREERLSKLREKLTEAVLELGDMKDHEPAFLRPLWQAKEDELVRFIESLE